MDDLAHVVTDRLDLRRPDPDGDLEAVFAIMRDPDGWWYDPGNRHAEPARTHAWLTRAATRFDADGLSYWTVRLTAGAIIGVGGAQRQRTGAWNLSYRIAGDQQGHGYATELSRAAQSAAATRDPGVPFIAWVAEHNGPSRRVAERLGLTNYGALIDPSDGALRLAYADRPVAGFAGDSI
jgi:RimJ/RimL family protein N-acetyltransferase